GLPDLVTQGAQRRGSLIRDRATPEGAIRRRGLTAQEIPGRFTFGASRECEPATAVGLVRWGGATTDLLSFDLRDIGPVVGGVFATLVDHVGQLLIGAPIKILQRDPLGSRAGGDGGGHPPIQPCCTSCVKSCVRR